jgi:hypothetical protein
MSVVVTFNGIIRRDRDHSMITEGTHLYRSLNETNRVLLLTDNRERTDIWLKTNNLSKKIDDIIEISDPTAPNAVFREIESIRSKGKIEFVVTDDPDLAKDLLEVGIPVLVFLNPKYTRPEFRPDSRTGVRSWDKITAELDRQQGLYTEDPRL